MSQKSKVKSPVGNAGKRKGQQITTHGVWNRCSWYLQIIAKVAAASVFLSVAVMLVLRFIPPPFSAFMLEKYLGSFAQEEGRTRIQYHWVPLESISPHMALAAVAAEDQKFIDHWGFDFQSIARALEEGEKRGRYRGASTITQQVAKNLFLWNGRSFVRKGLEAYFTVWMELLWSKKRILETYLNIAEFGDGIYGVHAAGKAFFRKNPAELTRHEAAMLAAVLPNPEKFRVQSPSAHVMKRSGRIEKQMKNLGDLYLKDMMQ